MFNWLYDINNWSRQIFHRFLFFSKLWSLRSWQNINEAITLEVGKGDGLKLHHGDWWQLGKEPKKFIPFYYYCSHLLNVVKIFTMCSLSVKSSDIYKRRLYQIFSNQFQGKTPPCLLCPTMFPTMSTFGFTKNNCLTVFTNLLVAILCKVHVQLLDNESKQFTWHQFLHITKNLHQLESIDGLIQQMFTAFHQESSVFQSHILTLKRLVLKSFHNPHLIGVLLWTENSVHRNFYSWPRACDWLWKWESDWLGGTTFEVNMAATLISV